MVKNKKPIPLKGDTLGKRIQIRLDKMNLKAATASVLSGNEESFVRNIMRKEATGKVHVPRADKLGTLAATLHTWPQWLLTGEGPEEIDYEAPEYLDSGAVLTPDQSPRMVRLIGYVSAGAEAKTIPIPDEDLDLVPAPPNSTEATRALEIRGTSLGELFDRWIVFFDDVRRPVTPDLIGKLCVVGLEDGRIVVKKIKRATGGAYELLSNTEPPMAGVFIEWAAKVRSMEPR